VPIGVVMVIGGGGAAGGGIKAVRDGTGRTNGRWLV